jgi:probable HAF family extracellular repeat protein
MKSTRLEQAVSENAPTARPEKFDVVDLGPFDNNRNNIHALNDSAHFAGVSLNPATGRIEAFRQQEEIRQMLGTLGGSFSIARDLNDNGEVVGGSLTGGDESFHGFLYRDNRLYDLNDFLEPGNGWELLQALGINNHGEILAVGSNTGQDRIVLLRPRT